MQQTHTFILLLFLLLSGLSGPLTAQKWSPYPPDSLIWFHTHEAPDHSTKLNWSDSLWVVKGTDTLRIYSQSESCVEPSGCDTLYYELFTPCQIFRLPRLVRCVKLAENRYALLGYTTQHPFYIKHIWVLDTEKELKLSTQVTLATRRTLDEGIEFAYDAAHEEIVINSRDIALMDEHAYTISGCTMEQLIVQPKRTFYEYKIWLTTGEDQPHMQEYPERIIRVPIGK